MLNTDALEINSRLEIAEDSIRKDFVINDFDMIKGLEIVKTINEEINPEVINDDIYALYKDNVRNYCLDREKNFSILSKATKAGINHGLAIVSSVNFLNKNKKVKIKGNN